MSAGFRVYTERLLPSQNVVEAFKKLPAANVADCMNRSGALDPEIRLMGPRFKGTMAGVALTVSTRSGDNLMLHKALNMAREGDVVVVSANGERSRALIGEVMLTYAKYKNVTGFVFDGPIRDIEALDTLLLPVYATGTTPAGPFKEGPGEINTPIACGNVRVNPGDIVLGDADGLVIVPRLDAEAILEKAVKFSAFDQGKIAAAAAGTADRSWVDTALAELGCEVVEGVCPS